MAKQFIYAPRPTAVENLRIERGQIVGEIRDGKPVPTIEGVTRGHLVPRLADGRLVVGDPAEFQQPKDAGGETGLQPPYKGRRQAELLAEVNRRRKAGRPVEIESQKVAALIAALEADDEQLELQAEANEGQNE